MPLRRTTDNQEKQIIELYKSGLSTIKISKYLGFYKQVILHALERNGIKRRENNHVRASGVNNGRWAGGIRTIKGYKHAYRPQHHLSRKDGWCAIHRINAEKKIGREISKEEVVHHIDGNIKNNSLENLQVYKNNGEHLSKHNKEFSRNKKGKYIKK